MIEEREDTSEEERRDESLEKIDCRVGGIDRQFRRVSILLTELFERQMALEEMVRGYKQWVEQVTDEDDQALTTDGYLVWRGKLDELQQRAKDLLEKHVE